MFDRAPANCLNFSSKDVQYLKLSETQKRLCPQSQAKLLAFPTCRVWRRQPQRQNPRQQHDQSPCVSVIMRLKMQGCFPTTAPTKTWHTHKLGLTKQTDKLGVLLGSLNKTGQGQGCAG